MKFFKGLITLCAIGGMLLMVGCSEESNYSPEQMINNALDEKETESYVGEATTTVSENGDVIETMIMKEWHNQDGKIRVEVEDQDSKEESVSVNDGEKITTYNEGKNQAIIIDDKEILEFNQPSPKEQVDFILDMVRDTHEISGKGEEEVAGRTTYHLVANPKEDNTLFGKQEMWIDKENWMALKIISDSGNQKTEVVYNDIEFDTDIPEDTFTLDLPDDVDIVNSDDLLNTEEATLEEAKEGIGQPFYYFPEKDGLEISTIEKDELTGELDRTEVNIDYKKEGDPFLTLSVFESPQDLEDDFTFPEEKEVTIRDQDGTFTDTDGFRAMFWQEDGLNYSLVIIDPTITLEELQKLAESMNIVK